MLTCRQPTLIIHPMRINLITPSGAIMDNDMYNKTFTAHGVVMLFLFLIPSIPGVMGNFFVPIMIGAKDMAFPKLNIASWYVWMVGAGVDPGDRRALGGEPLQHPARERIVGSDRIEASTNARLIGDDDGNVAARDRQANEVEDTADPDEVPAIGDEAPIDVDHAVAVEEQGRRPCG